MHFEIVEVSKLYPTKSSDVTTISLFLEPQVNNVVQSFVVK